jgi:hypothetical protein
MRDTLVVLMTGGFFAACVAYIRLCDRIIGADPEPSPETFVEVGSAPVRGPSPTGTGPVRPRDQVPA